MTSSVSFEPCHVTAKPAAWSELFDHLRGRWTDALLALGIDRRIVNKRNQPCPIRLCGGRDCFQYTDHAGEGNYSCRRCGSGRGFQLLRGVFGWPTAQAIAQLRAFLARHGIPPPLMQRNGRKAASRALELWEQGHPVSADNIVGRYLARFGLRFGQISSKLRYHPAVDFINSLDGKHFRHSALPAMLAAIENEQGELVSLHRTYLLDRASVPQALARKRMHRTIDGAVVRLAAPASDLVVTLDIESALTVGAYLGSAAWAVLDHHGLGRLVVPACVGRLDVFTANDSDRAHEGQAAAFALATRLKHERADITVEVHVPPHPGQRWSDAWDTAIKARR
ncbi:primase-helicase zinc-binding domain-containing protein [Massilia sp. TS11]|uniref:DUF7146 domain-containing protein n=1 Tax=Massilia sp. TS11 TaxID=2908003 RepID=UPI001EDBCD63|nr:primase-helicase zinc-binding domain-containing protein [Massilia sp. TS11]MCG2583903.1 hypothetical protein [Massilia sp. TS11]